MAIMHCHGAVKCASLLYVALRVYCGSTFDPIASLISYISSHKCFVALAYSLCAYLQFLPLKDRQLSLDICPDLVAICQTLNSLQNLALLSTNLPR